MIRWLYLLARRGNPMPISSTKNKQGNTTLNVVMGNGISTINKGMPVCLTLQDGYFMIQQRFSKNSSIVLKCSQIKKIQKISEKDFIAKNINLVGKAEKGESLFSLRAKIPGLKTQKSSNFKDYIVINYESTSKKVIIFEEVIGTTIGSKEFIQEVQETIKSENTDKKTLQEQSI